MEDKFEGIEIDINALEEEMKGMSPEQIEEYLNKMYQEHDKLHNPHEHLDIDQLC